MKKKSRKIILIVAVLLLIAAPAGPALATDRSTTEQPCIGAKTYSGFFSTTYTCQIKDSSGNTATQSCTTYPGDSGATSQTVCTIQDSQGNSNTINSSGGTTLQQSVDKNGTVTSSSLNSPIGKIVGTIAGWVTGAIATALLKTATAIVVLLVEAAIFFLMLFGLLFNFVVDQLVVNMGHFITSSSSSGIQTAWRIVRDLANIGIIGGLIATAIGTILQIANYSANKFLARLIIAALLVNFSYFFAGAIIDSSNYLATQFYTNLICGSAAECSNTTIAGTFQDIVNIQAVQSLQNTGSQVAQSVQTNSPGLMANGALKDLLSYVLFLVMILVTIFVFFSAIVLLLGRFVSLVFILITSPIGIAASAIPGVQKYAREWWDILFSQAFFAPIYFLMLGFSFTILREFSNTNAFSSIDANNPGAADMGTILNFIVATTFMILSLRLARQMSKEGEKYLGDFYKGAGKLTNNYLTQSLATETLGRISGEAGLYYRDKIAPRLSIFGRPIHKIPVLATIDRKLQKGLDSGGGLKFGGKESYLDTKGARTVRRTELTNKAEVLRKEEERNKAEAEERARKADVDRIGAETERKEEQEAPTDDSGPFGTNNGTGGGSPNNGGSAGGSPNKGTGPSPVRPSQDRKDEPRRQSGDAAERLRLSGTTPPAARPERPKEEEAADNRPRAARLQEVKDINTDTDEGLNEAEEAIIHEQLDKNRIYFREENGTLVPETDEEVLDRMGISRQRFIKTDPDGKRRAIREDEIRNEFGRQHLAPILDEKTGKVMLEDNDQFLARYYGNAQRVVPIAWRGKVKEMINGKN